MQAESMQVPGNQGTERAVVLQVLGTERMSRAELLRALHDMDSEAVAGALSNLETLGIVVVEGEQVQASRAARHLDALGLISV